MKENNLMELRVLIDFRLQWNERKVRKKVKLK